MFVFEKIRSINRSIWFCSMQSSKYSINGKNRIKRRRISIEHESISRIKFFNLTSNDSLKIFDVRRSLKNCGNVKSLSDRKFRTCCKIRRHWTEEIDETFKFRVSTRSKSISRKSSSRKISFPRSETSSTWENRKFFSFDINRNPSTVKWRTAQNDSTFSKSIDERRKIFERLKVKNQIFRPKFSIFYENIYLSRIERHSNLNSKEKKTTFTSIRLRRFFSFLLQGKTSWNYRFNVSRFFDLSSRGSVSYDILLEWLFDYSNSNLDAKLNDWFE